MGNGLNFLESFKLVMSYTCILMCFVRSVMNLLSEIYSQSAMVPKMLETLKFAEKQELDLNRVSQAEEHGDEIKDLDNPYILSSLTPRLWPFMRHSITSVRHSAIRTLVNLSSMLLFCIYSSCIDLLQFSSERSIVKALMTHEYC